MLSAVKLCQSSSISGPSATAKPRSAKISASSSITWLTGWTDPLRRLARRQRQVEPLGRQPPVELGILQRRLARGDRRRHGLAQRVDPRPFAAALLGRHRAQRLEQGGDLARLAERRDAHRVERGEVGGGGNVAREALLQLLRVHAHFLGRTRGLKQDMPLQRKEAADAPPHWPELDVARDQPTFATLHLVSQMLGKLRVAHAPWVNHGWHVTLHPRPDGLAIVPIAAGDGSPSP